MKLPQNLCKCIRAVFVVGGFAIASLAFWGPQNLWFLLGLIPATAGALGYCPLYALIKKDTCTSGSCCCCKKKD